ncbi:TPA_asm: maturation protein [ssRNA phage AIN003]|uniref:Maturation protein n=2 Tax=Riboviria TaxID=2559587 RepID=A0A8S5KXF9_9VIRU|nr:maturation protein [ssRNA phage AIN003]APG77215.1 hypothetical protein [Hubei levi-like virus 13]DAD49848.1 TPA_asm: maturation protein [ssRNA phage AIN003]
MKRIVDVSPDVRLFVQDGLPNSSAGRNAKDFWMYRRTSRVQRGTQTTVTGLAGGNPKVVSSDLYPTTTYGQTSLPYPGHDTFWDSANALPPGVTLAECDRVCINALIDKVMRARENGFNMALFIGELPQAMSLFVDVANRLAVVGTLLARRGKDGLRDAALYLSDGGRRKNEAIYTHSYRRVKRKELFTSSADNYLAVKYGAAPLIGDVFSACEALANKLHKVPRFNIRHRIPLKTWETRSALDLNGSMYHERREFGYQAGLSYTVESDLISHAASLGFTNPMALAYQAYPLSFVFDWLIPVGAWLERFSAFHGLGFVDGWTSRRGLIEQTYTYTGTHAATYQQRQEWNASNTALLTYNLYDGYFDRTPSSVHHKVGGFTRNRMNAFPAVPRLMIAPASTNVVSKALSLVALTRQRLPQWASHP